MTNFIQIGPPTVIFKMAAVSHVEFDVWYLCVFCGMGSIFKFLVSRNDSSGDIVMYRFRFGLKLGFFWGAFGGIISIT